MSLMFIKTLLRMQKFKQGPPSLSLPLGPWGTWLDDAMYYCENYSAIEDIAGDFDSNEASDIKSESNFFFSNLSGNLPYIKSKLGGISTTISRLEAVGAEMHDDLVLVKSSECEVGHTDVTWDTLSVR
jgi:hypothetical protein